MTDLNFQEDLAIDLDDLHEEWRKHASIRHRYACQISDLDRKVKKAHEKLKVTKSQLIRNAFKDPKGCCDSDKVPTAAMLEAYYRNHPDHKEAKEDFIQAEYDLSMAYNAVRAFDDRKMALQDNVKLYLNNYFSTPREERRVEGGKSFIDENIKETQIAQRQALKKDNAQDSEEKQEEIKPKTRRRRK